MNFEPIISLVVAVSENGIIGRDGDMPWRLSTDLKRFKALTTGHPIIMGRKTFDSIGKPLPNRLNIVITRNMDWASEGVLRVSSLQAALDLASANLESIHAQEEDPEAELPEEIFVIGGGEIYRQSIELADALYVTHVLAHVEGDTSFPTIDSEIWEETHTEDIPQGEKDSHPTRYAIYERLEAEEA